MTVQLPAHLANRQVRSLTERASEGMGGSMPPHISLAGNSFTFVDAAGNEMKPMLTFDAVVIDVSDRLNKRYYDKPYNPKEQGEAPRCWSANGITPSREVAAPIAPQCDGCQLNVRGSAVSQISGSAIKACRDERWVAILVPQLPNVVFQLVVTPGSFKNWKAYAEMMKAQGVELSLALTRFSFVPGSTGELLFEFVNWVDAPTADVIEAANREGKTDALVGRSDPVRQPALAAPSAQPTLPPPNTFAAQPEVLQAGPTFAATAAPPSPATADQFSTNSAAATAGFGAAQPAAMTAQPMTTAPSVAPAQPAEQAAPRRRRRTAAEMAAAAAPAASGFAPTAAPGPSAPFGQPAPAAPVAAPAAPFGQPAPAAQFGMAPGAPINPEMAAMLAQMGMRPNA